MMCERFVKMTREIFGLEHPVAASSNCVRRRPTFCMKNRDSPTARPQLLPQTRLAEVYIGLQRGGLFVGQSGRFDAVQNSDNLAIQNYVSSIWVAHDGAVWVVTWAPGYMVCATAVKFISPPPMAWPMRILRSFWRQKQ